MAAKQLVQQMTLEEKAALCSGAGYWHTKPVQRLGLGAIMVADGPHGLRKQVQGADNLGLQKSEPATCFPPEATTANSFDEALMQQIGEAIGHECLAEGVSVVLGPGANIKRSPLCGRNFEYVSEDPYLTGRMAAASIEGVQSTGVGACLKHFAANNQEKFRMVNDSVVDMRALREIYLAGFETAVKRAKPWSLMCAYNRLNGTYACQHGWLLQDVLRGEWGFDGIVMTDWGAMDKRVPALKAGLELEMPGNTGNDTRLVAAVKSGALDETVLNTAAERLVEFAQKGLANRREQEVDYEAHNTLARRAAAESAVLLKNEGGLLPLAPGARVAVIGALAKQPRYQGSGSSKINPKMLDKPLTALCEAGLSVEYAPGYSLAPDAVPSKHLLAGAVRAAKGKDAVVLFVGLPEEYESEGYDRTGLSLPVAHNQLVNAVCRVNPNVVVVLQQGAPVALPWRDKPAAILAAYLGGQACGGALADVLTGRVNPGGRLAETWPLALKDTPAYLHFPGSPKQVQYRESIFVGYRWYDTAKRPVAYPFGHGLSYTSFAYSDISVSRKTVPEGNAIVRVKCKITNTGGLAGSEVVQLYVAKEESSIPRAAKELKAFAKIALQPGETKTVVLELDGRSFAYYNTAANAWCTEGGVYKLLVGASSRDIRLEGAVTAKGDGKEALLGQLREKAPVYFSLPAEGPFAVSDAAFRVVYGGPLPAEHEGRPYSWNSTLYDMRRSPLIRALMPAVNAVAMKFFSNDAGRAEQMMARAAMMEIPVRAAGLMTNGMITLEQVEGFVDLLNRKPARGVRRMVRGREKE